MKKTISFCAIIPAREGSKRIKLKNIVNFRKKPLIFWTIQAAISSGVFDKIYVSTDSEKIKNKVKSFKNIKILKRPKILALRKTKSEPVIRHVLKKIKKKHDYFLLLQPTSPLRTKYDIRNVSKIIKKNLFNTCISISKLKNEPFRIKHNGKIFIKSKFFKFLKNKNKYYYNGAIYAASFSFFLRHQNLYEKNANYYLMDKKNSIDIDTIEDLNRASKINERTQ